MDWPELGENIERQPEAMKFQLIRYVKRGVRLPNMKESQLELGPEKYCSPNPGLKSSHRSSNTSLTEKFITKNPKLDSEISSNDNSKLRTYPKNFNEFKIEDAKTKKIGATLRQNLRSGAGQYSPLKSSDNNSPKPQEDVYSASRITNQTNINIPVETNFKSLYDELFPEENEKAKVRNEYAVVRMETLPIFKWNPKKSSKKSSNKLVDLAQKYPEENRNRTFPEYNQDIDLATKSFSILSLDASSCSLEESDFFRLGPKGEHIERWATGIAKGNLRRLRFKDIRMAKSSQFFLFVMS